MSNSLDNLNNKNNIIEKDPKNTISCENFKLDVPIVNVKNTKIIEPIIINKFGFIISGIGKTIFFAFSILTPFLIRDLYLFFFI